MVTLKNISLGVILLIIVGSVVFLESRKTTPKGGSTDVVELARSVEEKKKQYEEAKEISTPDAFINTSAITLGELIGKKVILVDFWTYSCINCQRTTPYLNSWYEKYADKGLEIIGIHTPEFEFEKEYDNVARATQKFGIKFPVVLDNDYSTWRAYNNRYWPRKYLIDIDGFIVYDHIGEGAYEETEAKIVELLNERSKVLGEREVMLSGDKNVSSDEVNFTKVRTPETYLGYTRLQYLANLPSQECADKECIFKAPQNLSLNTYALDGLWKIRAEESLLVGEIGEIRIHFSANKVNLVAGAEGEPVRAEIFLDGKLVSTDVAGVDVKDGVVTFETHDLYNLIDLQGDYGEHELRIKFFNEGIGAFAFTFG